jgi:predicted GNAT family acetyltransferase
MAGNDGVTVRDNRAAMRFEAEVEGHLAILTYKFTDEGIVIVHTEVPKPIEGRGIASLLFKAALAEARKEGRNVVPVCPAFVAYVKRHAETHDIVAPSSRRALGLPEASARPPAQ